MKRVALVGVLVAATLAFAACNLNPQPFPPSDFTGGASDASSDAGPSPFGDADTDATVAAPDSGFADASVDAARDVDGDAGDASVDAASDAESDATGD